MSTYGLRCSLWRRATELPKHTDIYLGSGHLFISCISLALTRYIDKSASAFALVLVPQQMNYYIPVAANKWVPFDYQLLLPP
jgi:hypothetical protein